MNDEMHPGRISVFLPRVSMKWCNKIKLIVKMYIEICIFISVWLFIVFGMILYYMLYLYIMQH